MIHTHVNSSLAVDLDHNKKNSYFSIFKLCQQIFFPSCSRPPWIIEGEKKNSKIWSKVQQKRAIYTAILTAITSNNYEL